MKLIAEILWINWWDIMLMELITGILMVEYLLLLAEYLDRRSGLLNYQNLWDCAIIIM